MLGHVHGNSDMGMSVDRLTRVYNDTFGGEVGIAAVRCIVDRLVECGELVTLEATGAVAPSSMFLALYAAGGTSRVTHASEYLSATYMETYVPNFAAGFLIGKHGEFCSQILTATGVRVFFSPFRQALQKAVLNVSLVHPSCRFRAVQHTLVMLRRRIYALYYSYKTRSSEDVVENYRRADDSFTTLAIHRHAASDASGVPARAASSSASSSWSVWSHTPLSVVFGEFLVSKFILNNY